MLGLTDFLEEDIAILVEHMGEEDFTGDSYHLVQRNCNAFTTEFAKTITGTIRFSYPILSRALPVTMTRQIL